MDEYKLSSNLAISRNGFLFMPSSGNSYTLNSVGIFIIELMKNNTPNNEIVNRVAEEFDIDEKSAERDLDDFINQLKQYKMLELK